MSALNGFYLRGKAETAMAVASSADRRVCGLRPFPERAADPALIVTAYRTSKIGKYWRKP